VQKKLSRRLVIDASVARSATLAENPTSIPCRRFLELVLNVCHKVVLSKETELEWQNMALQIHTKSDEIRVRFLANWMLAMERKRKLVRPRIERDKLLRSKINHLGLPENSRQAIEEDFHLVEAALACDLIVVSRDDTVHRLLRGITGSCVGIRKIIWCNPVTLGEETLDWLRQGAPVVKVWQLGSKRE
jgi:hypothetical protein